VAGVPGIIVAALLHFTLREPIRGGLDRSLPGVPKVPLPESLRQLLGQKAFVFAVIASMAMGLHMFAMQVWSATFLRRIYHLNTAQIGTALAVLRTVLSVSGALLGGQITQTLAKRSPVWMLRFPALNCLVSGAALVGFLTSTNLVMAFASLGLINLTIGAQLGPVFSAVQTISPARNRALASAIFVLTTQLFGMGIGSVLVGALSDHFTSSHGADGLRFALLAPAAGAALGGLIYWIGARYVAADISRAARLDVAVATPDTRPT